MSERGRQRVRLQRVGEAIRHALAEILSREEIRDAALRDAMVTISMVEVSADLRHARVFVMPALSGDSREMVAALNRHRRFLRGRLAPYMRMKCLPELAFHLDRQFGAAQRIEELLRSDAVRRDLADPAHRGED
ncbi:MAG: ribosome-binding factor A [Rhodothalassiaceae bacterium]|nr:MAG: ribosome-binding factor A [Rhodothalassiaceae bacterium]